MTKREVAEVSIRNAIETGRYVPGQVISQRQLMEDLGLGVTPIREAILVLSGNGIVERHKHHSIRVSEITPDRLRDIFMVRQLLEQEAVMLTAQNCTDELVQHLTRINRGLEQHVGSPHSTEVNALDRAFHSAIFVTCQNDALVWTIDRVKSSFPMYALWNEPGRVATSVAEHWALIEALDTRDPKAAAAAQGQHLSNGLTATIAYLDHLMAEREPV